MMMIQQQGMRDVSTGGRRHPILARRRATDEARATSSKIKGGAAVAGAAAAIKYRN